MIVAVVRDGQLDTLRALLESMNVAPGRADPQAVLLPFAQFGTLHSARLVILESGTPDDIRAYGYEPWPTRPSLALLGEIDGDPDRFLAELAVRAMPGLERLFACCERFVERRGTLLEWMRSHAVPSAASYVNTRGRTVRRVHEEAALYRCLAGALPGLVARHGRENALLLRRELLAHVELERHAGRLTLTPPSRTPWGWRLRDTVHLIGVPVLLLAALPFVLVASPFVLWRLRVRERRDPEINPRVEPGHVRELSALEDHDVTNPFDVFGDVKPGLFRRALLSVVLLLVDYLARHVYNRGFLARVLTIHFARWVWIEERRHLYFASVYDGSLDSYMDDFINKVPFGLNLIFSHCVGYPTTRWAIKGGAEHEQEYKDTLRRAQLPSAVWYRAHPGMTARDMARNAELRDGIERRPTGIEATRRWLALV